MQYETIVKRCEDWGRIAEQLKILKPHSIHRIDMLVRGTWAVVTPLKYLKDLIKIGVIAGHEFYEGLESTNLYYGELLEYQITELTKEDLILSEYLHAEWKAPLYNELLKEG